MSKLKEGDYLICEQLENYAKTEEARVEELIKAVASSGATVIVSGGAIGEMAQHFCERYKYDLSLLCTQARNGRQLQQFILSFCSCK